MKKMWMKIKQSRNFLYVLIVIAIVWMISNMSEQRVYREHYSVVYDGVDTLRYTYTQRDSILDIDVSCNGFRAMRRSLNGNHTLHIDIAQLLKGKASNETKRIELNTKEFVETIHSQIDIINVAKAEIVTDQLKVELKARHRKGFVPDISKVVFLFDGMLGISGEPTVQPDTVWLYGSQESLDKIETLEAQSQFQLKVKRGGTYDIPLEPVWQQYPDLRISHAKVRMTLPVEKFVEDTVTVALSYATPDEAKRIHLYPAEVTIHYMVPQKNYSSINADKFKARALPDGDNDTRMKVVVEQFPAEVRIKEIIPNEVQYIVIK